MKENMKLWEAVCQTDPEHTKKANVKGNNLTSIKPQYQIMMATEQFGAYGSTWGFKNIKITYDLLEKGLVVFQADFFYPTGTFPAINTISIYRDNAQTKLDDEFAKKVETDSLTKCLSKLGFNADIFLGQFDDMRYVETRTKQEAVKKAKTQQQIAEEAKPLIIACKDIIELNFLIGTLTPNIIELLKSEIDSKSIELGELALKSVKNKSELNKLYLKLSHGAQVKLNPKFKEEAKKMESK